jgi:hypothetical protein
VPNHFALYVLDANTSQDLKKNFEEAGFKPQVKSLVDFQDAYGLEGGEDEEEGDVEISGSDGDDDESESGSEMEE